MSDNKQPPKRRKRAPMFYKIKYLQEGSTAADIPRQTLRDLTRSSASSAIAYSSSGVNSDTASSVSSYQEIHVPGSSISSLQEIPQLPSQPSLNQEVGSGSDGINPRDGERRDNEHGSDNGRGSGEDGDADRGGGGDGGGCGDGGGGGGGDSSGESSPSSDGGTDSSSDDESSNDPSSSDSSSGGSSEAEVLENDDYDTGTRERANYFRRKYSLDDKISQSYDNRISAMECLLLVLSFSLRHALDDVAVGNLLKLINQVMGQDVIPESSWVFNNIFHFDCGVDYHFYCLKCEIYIGKYSDMKNKDSVDCPNNYCDQKCRVSTMNDGHFFVSLPLQPQLKCFLENTHDIIDLLSYRFTRELSEGTIRDIFDGKLYRALAEDGEILSDVNNFSISFNTDGAPIFLSANNSMWPIQSRINELPPKLRFSSNNMFLCGLWFGSKSHPNMKVFLSQFCQEARSLHLEGFTWKQPSGEIAESKVVSLNSILDSVAKPDVQCMKQFNAYCACGYCYFPGVLVDLVKDKVVEHRPGNTSDDDDGGDDDIETPDNVNDQSIVNESARRRRKRKKVAKQVRYPFSQGGPYDERLDSEIRDDMVTSAAENKSVRGVKGISPLVVLVSFNLAYGFVIDAMHAVFLGVTKQLLKLWCDSKYSTRDFSVRKHMKAIDARLLTFKPPLKKKKLKSRAPRTIFDFPKWKANQLRDWLFIYCIPCLSGILPASYFAHLTLLVSAVYCLYSECISEAELNAAGADLLRFVKEFEVLYGPSQVVYNVHLLTHLARCVELWGPLWAYSAFSFENNNGVLKKLVMGTKGVMTQISRKYCTYRFLPAMIAFYDISDDISDKCKNLLITKKKKQGLKLDVYLLDPTVNSLFSPEEKEILRSVDIPHGNVVCYDRMISNGIMFHSKMYSRQGAKSSDQAVFLVDGRYGLIERILNFQGTVWVILRRIDVEQSSVSAFLGGTDNLLHVKLCKLYPYGQLAVVNARSIIAKCVVMNVPPRTFVAAYLNVIEGD